MIKTQWIKKAVVALTVFAVLASPIQASAKTSFSGEYRQGEILSFGSSLNKKEEAALREYFNVPADMEAIYVDNKTAIEQLGLAPNALDNYTGGWYSSAYVKLTDNGGVNVTSKNVSLVTNEMFANALITSGIYNSEVNVSAPFMVTGESALAGILAGAEEIMGESLSEENKVIAKEEIDTTLDIADEILNNKDNDIDSSGDSSNVASGIINDIKQQVIKDSPNSTQIQQIIINVTNQYGVELSEAANARVLSLMEDVNELDIEYKDIKDTMKNIGDSISESLKEAGIKLKESGFFERIFEWMGDFFRSIGNWFKELFTPANEVSSQPEDLNVPESDQDIETDTDESQAEEVLDQTVNESLNEQEDANSETMPEEEVAVDETPSDEQTESLEENQESTDNDSDAVGETQDETDLNSDHAPSEETVTE